MADLTNPLLEPSPLPYGLPLFALIRSEHYVEGLEAGMRRQRETVERIAADEAEPTFENTMLALERSGELLDRVLAVFENASSADATPELDEIDAAFAPRLSAHADAIVLDQRLFARVHDLFERRDELGLAPDAVYLIERAHHRALLAGAALDADARARLTAINARLSTLRTAFQQRLLADTNDLALHLTDEGDLAGLDAGARSAAEEAAAARGLEGWLITLVLPTSQPALADLESSGARDALLAASRTRGARGGPNDTRATLVEIARLRAERAALLGFASHAAAVIQGQTAGTPEAVSDLIEQLAVPAMRNVRHEQARLERLAETLGERAPTAADWARLTTRSRSARVDASGADVFDGDVFDASAVRPYLEFDRVLLDGVFHAANLLYGLRFTARPDLVGYHPDARVYEVRERDGAPVGLYLLDPYTRDSKRGGAWMNSLAEQSELTGELPIVVNNLNIPKPAAGEPTLLTLDEAATLFHEFGHALHGLLARVRFPSQAGTRVFRDFVELPSQVNELWLTRPEILERFAVHHETGEPMPADVAAGLLAATGTETGFATAEYLAAAALDLAWHRLSPADLVSDVARFEAESLDAVGLAHPLVPPRYGSSYFAHVFAGGYDAGYYSYIWSEVPGADIMAWFEQHGGATPENGDRFRREILAPGGSRDPGTSVRAFLGREPSIDALIARRGLG
ncbi:peptidyl-dipeptidase Dcp [Agromyces terreus]|uniref:Peptidyl-dipeptidase Dcp n=1 Tax=Agromyces terreus TaxID=424795 RepID=A0A9X2KFQ8_9MICO|nr:M3 family metallopeptidase [Agromyces terreus]MCP2372027.1 peptidyl-dipeptidase Dcp [Agromyces terreus]